MNESDDNFSTLKMFIKHLERDDESFKISKKDQTGCNRRSVPASEYLKKCRGEMVRYLDAAEVYCEKRDCLKSECDFWVAGESLLPKLREILPYF